MARARVRGPGRATRNRRVVRTHAGQPQGPGPARFDASDAALILNRSLADRHAKVLAELARCARKGTEPAIHDLRVAIRRLLASLRLAAALVPDGMIPKQRRLLRETLRAFNDLRDVHISLLAMQRLRRTIPTASLYSTALREQERRILRDVGRRLKTVRTTALEKTLARVEQALLDISADPLLRSAAMEVLRGEHARAYLRAVRARRAIRSDEPSSIHRLRIAFKRYRYMSEILSPLLPWMTSDRRKAMQAYQTAMGEIQDLEVLTAGVNAFVARRPMGHRAAMMPVQEALARQRQARIEAFVRDADMLGAFWGDFL